MMGACPAKRRLRRALAHLRPSTVAGAPPLSDDQLGAAADRERWGEHLAPRPIGPADGGQSTGAELSAAEAEHFRRTGWLIKRGLVPACELEPWVDRFWKQGNIVQPGVAARGDPASYVDPAERWQIDQGLGHGHNLLHRGADSKLWVGEWGHDPG